MSSLSTPMPIRLNGRSLLAGRLLYLLLFLLCLGMFIVSLTYKFVQGTSGCDSVYNAEWAASGNWCVEWFQAIVDLRITAITFESYFLGLRVMASLPFFILSFLLVRRRSQELRVLLLAGLLLVIGIAGTWFNPFWAWGGWWLEAFSPYPSLKIFSPILTFLLVSGAFLFVCLFPNGRFFPHWSRWLAGSWLLLSAGNIFLPDTIFAMGNWPFPLHSLVPFAYVLLGISIVILRYQRQATVVQRQQIKWITFGMLLVAFNFLIDFAVFDLYETFTGNYPLANGQQAVYWELGQDTLSHLSQFVLGICFSFAILRQRLWDIDLIISRALVYSGLTVLIVALYIGIVGGLGALLQTQTNTVAGLVATAVIAVLFQPLRERLQQGINRLLYGERDNPTAVFSQLAQQLETTASPDDILPNLVHTIAYTLKLPHVAIWLPNEDDNLEPVAHWGQTPDHVEMLPLTYHKETIGQLVVAPRDANGRFDHRERPLLQSIAALTANTVRAVMLSDKLRQSRQRIITAREEERRRLRRDLHDGLGPQLASQTLGLEAIGQLLDDNKPQKAHELLAALKTQAQEAIVDVRRLVYKLRPPALDDLGLVGALQQSVVRLGNDALRIEVEVPKSLPNLPAAVETAVYRITQEALTNVVRHAHATTCTISLTTTDHEIILEIVDNGQGFANTTRTGVGLQSMRERAAELNGRCVIESRPEGGTKVQAWLPLNKS